MKFLSLLALLVTSLSANAGSIRVACVGDSITQGVGVSDPKHQSYPALLGKILGSGYNVENFGYSGATLLEDGNNPYRKTTAFREATRFDPKIVVIALGTNDSKTINWDGREEQFRPDYAALIEHFAKLPSKPKIFVCLPPPSFQGGNDIRERILARQRPLIKKIAASAKLPVIDLYAPLKAHPECLPDGVHPNAQGAQVIAETVAAALRK